MSKTATWVRKEQRSAQYYGLRNDYQWCMSDKTRDPVEALQQAFGDDLDVVTMLALEPKPVDRDWTRFQDHFWPGATLTTVWAPDPEEGERVVVTTIPDFVAQAPLGPGSREVFEERMVSARLEIAGGLAQAWVRYDARFGDPGAIVEWSGIDAFNLIRHQGQWRIVSLAYAADGG